MQSRKAEREYMEATQHWNEISMTKAGPREMSKNLLENRNCEHNICVWVLVEVYQT